MDETLDSLRADATNRGVLAHVSKTEARILYTRNLLLILLSLVVGGRALLSIWASWRSAALSPVRKFTHFLVRLGEKKDGERDGGGRCLSCLSQAGVEEREGGGWLLLAWRVGVFAIVICTMLRTLSDYLVRFVLVRDSHGPPLSLPLLFLQMSVLLSIELLQCVIWFLGMNLAALHDGALPNPGTLNLGVAMKWCAPLGAISYWLDLMNSLWHAVVAWKVWSWVYLHQPVYVLCRNLIYMAGAVLILATGLTLVPVFEQTLGLSPHSHCFLTTLWKKDGHPTAAYMLNRWIVLPICWFAVVGFNCATIYVLKKEARFLPLSAQRLQLRLLLVTISFCVLWGLMAVPSYLFVRTFAADFLLRVSDWSWEK